MVQEQQYTVEKETEAVKVTFPLLGGKYVFIKQSCFDEVEHILNENGELLAGERQLDLFSTESIFDLLPKTALIEEQEIETVRKFYALTGSDITAFFESYILTDTLPDWIEPQRWFTPNDLQRRFGGIASCSDQWIIQALTWSGFEVSTLSYRTLRVGLREIYDTSRKPTSFFIFDKEIDYERIISAVRSRYGIKKSEWSGVEGALKEIASCYIRDLVGKEKAEDIRALANKTASPAEFKKMVRGYLTANNMPLSSSAGMGGGMGDGFSVTINFGFTSPKVHLSILNTIDHYMGHPDFDPTSHTRHLKTYEDGAFWEMLRGSLAASLF